MAVQPIPDGYPAVIPYLIVAEAARFIGFMQTVFGAAVKERMDLPDGRIKHAELVIRDSMIMLGDPRDGMEAMPVMLHFYVEDVDKVYAAALAAGAVSISPPADQFYGDRSAGCAEPCGNTIWLATHIEDVAPAELARRAALQGR